MEHKLPESPDTLPTSEESLYYIHEDIENLQKSLDDYQTVNVDDSKDLLDAINNLNETLTNKDMTANFTYNGDTEGLASQLQTLIDLLTPINGSLDLVSTASSAVVTYSVFYVPLIIIVLMLWWFFRQFIR